MIKLILYFSHFLLTNQPNFMLELSTHGFFSLKLTSCRVSRSPSKPAGNHGGLLSFYFIFFCHFLVYNDPFVSKCPPIILNSTWMNVIPSVLLTCPSWDIFVTFWWISCSCTAQFGCSHTKSSLMSFIDQVFTNHFNANLKFFSIFNYCPFIYCIYCVFLTTDDKLTNKICAEQCCCRPESSQSL